MATPFQNTVIELLKQIKLDTSGILDTLKGISIDGASSIQESIDITDMNIGFVDEKLDQILEYIEKHGGNNV